MSAARTHPGLSGVTAVAAALAATAALPVLLVVAALMSAPPSSGPIEVADIPARYLLLYRAAADRFRLGPDGWSTLAAVGKVECDHGRSPLVGCHRGEANSAGARGPAQFLAATWKAYGVDGDADGDRDVYDPADAIHGIANYLHASGAPADWRKALFAYNHADWYVERVLDQAAEYRRSATLAPSATTVTGDGRWLAPLPGFPGERCDARIVADVVALARAYALHVSDCFGGAPHAINGEHPLGLAIDASPTSGDWGRTEQLARQLGWTESCAATGCGGRGPMRLVLYNGYPGHGDPAHTSTPHIHVSWAHAAAPPFSRAPWVRVLFSGVGARP